MLSASTSRHIRGEFPPPAGLLDQAKMVLITYDPAWDTPEVLREYEQRGLELDDRTMFLRPSVHSEHSLLICFVAYFLNRWALEIQMPGSSRGVGSVVMPRTVSGTPYDVDGLFAPHGSKQETCWQQY